LDRFLGVYYWFKHRLIGERCWAQGCGRLLILHWPWQEYHCNRTPMAITITPEGEAAYQAMVIDDMEQHFVA